MEKILLTGQPGVGKSTTLSRLESEHVGDLTGVIAREVLGADGRRVGFTSGTLEDPSLFVIAHVDSPSAIRVGPYGVNVDQMDGLAHELAAQIAIAKENNLVLLFDEIGWMQSFSDKLKAEIDEMMDSDIPAIITIKQDDSVSDWLRDIKQRPGVRLITLTADNREEVLSELSAYVTSAKSRRQS